MNEIPDAITIFICFVFLQ